MSRSVLFDTETTGLDPATGDRIIEFAAIELLRDLPTARVFHVLIDPERDIPEEATRIHGFTRADLVGKPKFADIVDELMEFLGDAPLVAHNAAFDFGFVNAELAASGFAAAASVTHDRHAGAGQGALPRHAEQPERAVRPLQH